MSLLINLSIVGAMVLLLFGLPALRLRFRQRMGPLGVWGNALTAIGLIATVAGCLTTIIAGALSGAIHDVVAAVGIPAWILAHLVYVGATVLGFACWKVPAAPRVVVVPLIASLPVMVIGVLCGLRFDGATATIVTWASTEGQLGLAWLLVGGFLWWGTTAGGSAARTHLNAIQP